jgi:hypothetical protein
VGQWYVHKLPKLVRSAFFLRVLIGISYYSQIFGILKAFSDEIRAGNAVRTYSTELEALFQLNGSVSCRFSGSRKNRSQVFLLVKTLRVTETGVEILTSRPRIPVEVKANRRHGQTAF